MKKTILSTLAAALIPSLAFASISENASFSSLQQFNNALLEIPASAKPLLPQDAFAGIEECRIVDSKPLVAYSLPAAYKSMKSCLAALSASPRYKVDVGVKIGVVAVGEPAAFGLIIQLPANAFPGMPLYRDLNHSLMKRRGQLMGQAAILRRQTEAESSARSFIQESVDQCVLLTQVRPLASAADFVKYYGRCITQDRDLQVTQLRPSTDPNRKLGIVVVTAGDQGLAESLNGFVTVNSGEGRVNVTVSASPASAPLP